MKAISGLKTASDFIEFFTDIPDEKWGIGKYCDAQTGKCCALGLLGYRGYLKTPEEFIAVCDIFRSHIKTVFHDGTDSLNDGNSVFKQPTPKGRILAALEEVKALGF